MRKWCVEWLTSWSEVHSLDGTSARIVTKGCNADWMRETERETLANERERDSRPILHRGHGGPEGGEVFLFKRNGTRRDIIA